MDNIAVSMRSVSKFFGNFCALDKVDLNVRKGTIHSLLGENGAGKSTLMNILYGWYNADMGEIYINGKKVDIKTPNIAIKLGIGMVHQHFMLVDTLTVAQNIILGMETTNALGMIDYKKVKEDIVGLSKKYGLFVDPDAKVQDISVGMQQRVEILKTLYRGAEILILDEPTAVLTPQEILDLIKIMHSLIDDGKTVIIITHKLKEIKQSSDYCTIIRRGKYIDTVTVSDVSEHELASKMVGREVNLHVEKSEANLGDTVFKIENLCVEDARGIEKVRNLCLELRKGEILGIAGIDGNGQKELVEAITNLCSSKSGKITVNNIEIQNTTPRFTIKNKVSTIHEDRQKRGLVMDFTCAENSVIENFDSRDFSNKGILKLDTIKQFCNGLIERFDVRPKDCANLPVRALSGGNQQKLIIAREVTNDPEVLVAVQPTRGLDVGAIEFVHKSLIKQRDNGKAVLLISFELDEVMDLSDRIAVLYDGSIVKVLDNENTDENYIGLLMAGGGKNGETERL